MQNCKPCIAGYPGAKNGSVGDVLASLLWTKNMSEYWEVFGGTYGVGIKKDPFKKNYYSDANYKLAVLLKVLSKPEKAEKLFIRMLEQEFSEKTFEVAKNIANNNFLNIKDEIEKAMYAWIVLLMSVNGQMKNFKGISKGTEQLEYRKRMINKRHLINILNGLEVFNKDAFKLIKKLNERKDAENIMLFLDPPYTLKERTKNIYECELTMKQQEELLVLIIDTPCKVILCAYQNKLYDETLLKNGWHFYKVKDVKKTMSISKTGEKKSIGQEVVYMNYSMEELIKNGKSII